MAGPSELYLWLYPELAGTDDPKYDQARSDTHFKLLRIALVQQYPNLDGFVKEAIESFVPPAGALQPRERLTALLKHAQAFIQERHDADVARIISRARDWADPRYPRTSKEVQSVLNGYRVATIHGQSKEDREDLVASTTAELVKDPDALQKYPDPKHLIAAISRHLRNKRLGELYIKKENADQLAYESPSSQPAEGLLDETDRLESVLQRPEVREALRQGGERLEDALVALVKEEQELIGPLIADPLARILLLKGNIRHRGVLFNPVTGSKIWEELSKLKEFREHCEALDERQRRLLEMRVRGKEFRDIATEFEARYPEKKNPQNTLIVAFKRSWKRIVDALSGGDRL